MTIAQLYTDDDGDRPHTWTWWVAAKVSYHDTPGRYHVTAPHRAAAKRLLVATTEAAGHAVEWLGTVSIPPETTDCIDCRIHEGMQKLPNMQGNWDWECLHCNTRVIGHPSDPEVVRS